MHTFEFQVTPVMARRAWNAWCLPRIGGLWLPLPAIALIITGILLDLQSGGLGISSVMCLSVLGFALVLYVGIYFVGLKRAVAKWPPSLTADVVYTLTEDTIEASSSMGSKALAWRSLSEVRRKGDIVLLGFMVPATLRSLPKHWHTWFHMPESMVRRSQLFDRTRRCWPLPAVTFSPARGQRSDAHLSRRDRR